VIFGRTLAEGGVLALSKVGSEYIFRGIVEGGSFAVNWRAATQNLRRLKAMNSGLTLRELTKPTESDPEISDLIISGARPHDRMIFFHWAQFIVNPEPAAKHIEELTAMNRETNPFLECDLHEVFHLRERIKSKRG